MVDRSPLDNLPPLDEPEEPPETIYDQYDSTWKKWGMALKQNLLAQSLTDFIGDLRADTTQTTPPGPAPTTGIGRPARMLTTETGDEYAVQMWTPPSGGPVYTAVVPRNAGSAAAIRHGVLETGAQQVFLGPEVAGWGPDAFTVSDQVFRDVLALDLERIATRFRRRLVEATAITDVTAEPDVTIPYDCTVGESIRIRFEFNKTRYSLIAQPWRPDGSAAVYWAWDVTEVAELAGIGGVCGAGVLWVGGMGSELALRGGQPPGVVITGSEDRLHASIADLRPADWTTTSLVGTA